MRCNRLKGASIIAAGWGKLTHLFAPAKFLMPLIRFRILMTCAAIAACATTANAAVYGKVENGRVSMLYADTPPADRSYKLYSNGNGRFNIHPNAYRSLQMRNQAKAELAALEAQFANGRATAANGRANYGPVAMPSTFDKHILAASQETKVDAGLIKAVISVESGYNPTARSPKGATGLMQLMPETARRYGVKDIRDPRENIHGGARYLRDLMTMFNNDIHLVLAAYNAGEEAVMKYGRRIPPYAETTAYVPKVLSRYKKSPLAAAEKTPLAASTSGD
jgi:soluble lytic murein transglycosylase-like protein